MKENPTIAAICPTCLGTGWIVTMPDDPYDQYIPDYERCPACHGKKAPVPTEPKEGEAPSGDGV